MSARSGSLGWVVIAGTISLVIAGAMWGLMEATFVEDVIATDTWSAPANSIPAQGRAYVMATWDWFLLVVVLRLGIEVLVASRLSGASTNIPLATMVVLFAHLMMILWALVFPEVIGSYYDYASNTSAVANAGFMSGPDLAYQWGVGVLPAVLLLLADVWYLSEPIRNDLLRA